MISSSILQKSANGFWSKDDEKPHPVTMFSLVLPCLWGGDRFCMVVMWGKKGAEAMNDGGCEAR